MARCTLVDKPALRSAHRHHTGYGTVVHGLLQGKVNRGKCRVADQNAIALLMPLRCPCFDASQSAYCGNSQEAGCSLQQVASGELNGHLLLLGNWNEQWSV